MSQPKGRTILSGNVLKGTHNVQTNPTPDRNPSVAEFDYYNIRIQSMESHINDHGGHVDLRTTMELRTISTTNKCTGSNAMRSVEEFTKDIQILNAIKKSDHIGVQSLWGQLETLLALTKETDK